MTEKEKSDKYVLLQGKEHGNVFWTRNVDVDEEKFKVLHTGNDTKEMVEMWTVMCPGANLLF